MRSNRSRFVIPGASPIYSMRLLFRGGGLLQVDDQVAARCRLGDANAHSLARRKFLGVSQPSVERGFVLDQVRGLQGVGVSESRRLRRLASEHTSVRRTDAVVVQRMARRTACLVEREAGVNVSGGQRRKGTQGHASGAKKSVGGCHGVDEVVGVYGRR